MTAIVELVVASPPEAWRRLGLAVDDAGRCRVGRVDLRFDPAAPGHGIVGWQLSDGGRHDGRLDVDIDGLPTRRAPSDVDPDAGSAASAAGGSVAHPGAGHRLGASRIDHVVVVTSSLERTCSAIERATGEPLKRIREAGKGVRQGFHRLDEVVLEVVERPDVPGDAPASFWGFVLVVDRDLHDVCEELGPEIVGLPKPAVQPGRLIATVRETLGLGVPLALMSG